MLASPTVEKSMASQQRTTGLTWDDVVGMFPEEDIEPDVMFFTEESSRRIVERPVEVVPELVIEVSSPSTRKRDRTIKRDLYARGGVPEPWFVDLDADHIEVSRLEGVRYDEPGLYRRGEVVESEALPGFSVSAEDVLGPTPD
ncbi:MAG: Uma2 family endonuclease [Actinomycetota bacterium]